MRIEKALYFADSLWKRVRSSNMACPNCGSVRHEVQDRKFLVTDLRRCHDCKLMFRAPTDSSNENWRFYQSSYTEGFTTDMPSDEALARMTASRFAGTEKSYDYYVGILEALGLAHGARVFDYGCSWGYGSWQFAQAGFEVTSYEISRPRADFARSKLGVNCLPDPPAPKSQPGQGSFDCFFSAHVLEHVPSPGKMLAMATQMVRPGGYLVIATPNGTLAHRARHPAAWHAWWGKVHPHMIDDVFYREALSGKPLMLGGSPIDTNTVRNFAAGSNPHRAEAVGDELICICRVA